MISIVIAVHNEGREVARTVASILARTHSPCEIVIVDDGSDDGCCAAVESAAVRVIRHPQRLGVACSRDEGAQLARGDVLAFFDGHQRVTDGCLDRCAEIARGEQSIVWPDVRGFRKESPTHHGATFRLCPERGYFTATWNAAHPEARLSRITSLRCPGYVMSRRVYDRVRWIDGLRNWGASEAAISLKAFFLDIPLVHLCGVVARHRFKAKLEYSATWEDVWRNQALIARVCFDDDTWQRYWLPEVFQPHLSEETRLELDSAAILAQHQEFQRQKTRRDEQFWTDLVAQAPPFVTQ